jgi:hypothetical protein
MQTLMNQIIANVTTAVRENPSLPCLIEQYKVLEAAQIDDRRARQLGAEICYLIASNMAGKDKVQAREFARKSVRLYKSLNIQTTEEATPLLHTLLPELMHEGVVEARLLPQIS